MPPTTELCAFCQKSYRSLIQHYRKSFCGQIYESKKVDNVTENSKLSKKRYADDANHDSAMVDTGDDDPFLFDDHEDIDEDESPNIPPVYFPAGTVFHPPEKKGQHFTYTNQQKGYVRLLTFLDKHNAPKYAFDELLEILRLMSIDKFDFRTVHPKRKSIIQNIRHQYVAPSCERIPVPMERDEGDQEVSPRCTPDTVHIYRFNVEDQIRDLLAEDIFNDISNLVVTPDNPYGKYIPPDNRYNEINSGDWYRRTFDEKVKDPDNESLLCLKIYIDKTGCDPMLQRHGLEPVMFTFTIIKRQVQHDCIKAWRHIGFIPDLDQRPKSESAYSSSSDARRGRSNRNYHRCFHTLMKPLYELQKTGMKVLLRIGDHVKPVHAHLPVAVIIGDGKSQDTLCCRVPHYDQPRMSRACYTSFADCCKPQHKCVWVKQEEQRALSNQCAHPDSATNKELIAHLKSVSTVRCESSLFQMDFGSSLHGQFRACTVDPMHLFEGGWCASVAKAFVRPLRTRVRMELDILLERIHISSRSSVRDRFPRINFSGGATSMTQIASHEWPGVLLAYLIALQMPQGKKLITSRLDDDDTKFHDKMVKANKKAKLEKRRTHVLKKHKLLSAKERFAIHRQRGRSRGNPNESFDSSSSSDDENSSSDEDSSTECEDELILIKEADEPGSENQTRCTLENIIQLLEMMLCFHSFYKNSTYWTIGDKKAYKEFDQGVRTMMSQLVGTLHRGPNTNNWNTQKTHEVLHLAEQICEYGHLMNADTGVGERGLKYWAKKPARSALKGSIDVFTESTAKQVVDTMILRKASEIMGIDNIYFSCTRSHSRSCTLQCANNTALQQTGELVGDPKFSIVGRWIDGHVQATCQWFGCTAKRNDTGVPEKVLDLFVEEYIGGEENEEFIQRNDVRILGYTEYRLPDGNIVRAHPNYRSDGPFYDWCIVRDPNEGHDIATQHKTKLNDGEQRCASLSRVETRWGNDHLPCRVVAFYKHPTTGISMAMILPCRPWMNQNERRSSVITEHWNIQCKKTPFYKCSQSILWDQSGVGRKAVHRYLPMYHLVEAASIKEVVFGIQENGIFSSTWDKNGGNALIICDRKNNWGREFLDFGRPS
jgi:hypothetical protein